MSHPKGRIRYELILLSVVTVLLYCGVIVKYIYIGKLVDVGKEYLESFETLMLIKESLDLTPLIGFFVVLFTGYAGTQAVVGFMKTKTADSGTVVKMPIWKLNTLFVFLILYLLLYLGNVILQMKTSELELIQMLSVDINSLKNNLIIVAGAFIAATQGPKSAMNLGPKPKSETNININTEGLPENTNININECKNTKGKKKKPKVAVN